MNKTYGMIFMNLAVMGLYASEPNLEETLSAIKSSDLLEAKHQWELLDRSIKSTSEKKELLEQLKNAADSVDRKKSICKLAAGSLVWLGSTIANQHGMNSTWYITHLGNNSQTNAYLNGFLMSARTVSLLFIKDGIAGLIYGEGSTKSALVRDYFNELAQKQ